jgi:RNase P/RNase MRP subunit p29
LRLSCVDLLGREVSTYRCSYGVRGVVVGETHNTFLVLAGSRVVAVPKSLCHFYVYGLNILVNGVYLVGYRDRRLFNCGVF